MRLAEFIEARLGDDEAAAKAAQDACGSEMWFTKKAAHAWFDAPVASHILRHDPARVLLQVAAMRAILALHAPELRQLNNPFAGTTRVEYEASCPVCECEWPCPEVRIVAAIWSDHPDYDPESRTL